MLEFLDLKGNYIERELEDAILRELEHFLLELGAGFSFIRAKSAFSWTAMISTSTCSSITASCDAWSPSI